MTEIEKINEAIEYLDGDLGYVRMCAQTDYQKKCVNMIETALSRSAREGRAGEGLPHVQHTQLQDMYAAAGQSALRHMRTRRTQSVLCTIRLLPILWSQIKRG